MTTVVVGPWTAEDRKAAARTGKVLRMLSPTAHQDLEAYAVRVADIAWRARGIVVGDWRCLCGEAYTVASYPRAECKCGRPYPRRCVTAGCGRVVEACEIETVGDRLHMDTEHRGGPLVDLRADGLCDVCAKDKPYKARATTWSQSSVPKHERALVPQGFASDSRENVVRAIERWLDGNLGRSPEIGPCALYLHGQPGRGKTMAAAWAAYQALVDRGLVSAVTWTSQAELKTKHDETWRRDTPQAQIRADLAAQAWTRAREAHLLVVDDLFTAELRGAFAEQMADLIRERLNQRLPTLYTSNHAPDWGVWFEADTGRITSRWASHGATLEVGGPDWRVSRQ